MPLAPAGREERRSGDDCDAGLERLARDRDRVGALGQLEPGEEAALRPRPVRTFADMAVERVEERITPPPVQAARLLDLTVEVAAARAS